MKVLCRLTGGVPRLLNIICDRALLGTYIQGKEKIDRRTLINAAQEVTGNKISRSNSGRNIRLLVLAVILLLVGALYVTQKLYGPGIDKALKGIHAGQKGSIHSPEGAASVVYSRGH